MSSGVRIDAHTHFAPPRFLDFAEKAEGRPFPLTPLYKSKPALTESKRRIELLDHNGIDVNVLVPVPWIEAFHKVYTDPALATQAARLMNDELAAIVASQPTRFRGVAILPVIDPDAMVTELRRAISQLGFLGAYVAVGPTAKRLNHPDYEILYKTLVELDATLWLHPSRPPFVPDHPDDKLSQYYEWQLVGWPSGIQWQRSRPLRILLSFRPSRNARTRSALPSGDAEWRNPITGIAGCCARATPGHVAAAPPTSVMNSRRRISAPWLRTRHRNGSNEHFHRGCNRLRYCNMRCWPMSAMGQKRSSESRIAKSAMPPKAIQCSAQCNLLPVIQPVM